MSQLVDWVILSPDLTLALLTIVKTEKGSIRFSATKVLRLVSERNGKILLPYLQELAELMTSENSFLKWDGILTVSNLLASATEGHDDTVFQLLLEGLKDPQMITAANTARGLSQVAKARPELEPEISRSLLASADCKRCIHGETSAECRYIYSGHLLEAFHVYIDTSGSKSEMLAFARSLSGCPRPSVAKAALKFLKKHDR